MNRRRWLVYSIVTTIADELAVLLISTLVLPLWGLKLPWQLVTGFMIALACWGVIGYYIGVSLVGRRAVIGNGAMIGKTGVVVRALEPEGMVKIEGELWQADAASENVDAGAEVQVVSERGTHVTVTKKPAQRQ